MSTVIAPTPEELLLQRLLEQGAEPLPIAGLSDELKERLELEISIAPVAGVFVEWHCNNVGNSIRS